MLKAYLGGTSHLNCSILEFFFSYSAILLLSFSIWLTLDSFCSISFLSFLTNSFEGFSSKYYLDGAKPVYQRSMCRHRFETLPSAFSGAIFLNFIPSSRIKSDWSLVKDSVDPTVWLSTSILKYGITRHSFYMAVKL